MADQSLGSAQPGQIPAAMPRMGDPIFRRLLDRLPAGAYLCDAEGLITYYNEHAVRLWGRAPRLNDPVDRFCGSFRLFTTDGVPIPHEECWMGLALREQREYNGHEIVIERPDGERITGLAHANPIHDDSGRLLGAVNVLVDISDQKRAELALVEAVEAKSEFLATVSHEIRTPLNAIIGYLALLEMETAGPLTDGQRSHVARIEGASRHLLSLIEELLDFSRLEAGRVTVATEVLVAEAVVEPVLEMTRPLARAKGIQLGRRGVAADLAYVGDEGRVRQLLINLVANAIKFSGRGGPVEILCDTTDRPDIGLAVEATSERWVRFRVRDQGIGIPPDQLQRIFEPFVQVEGTRTRQHGGTGLGLTISRRLARLMGGDLTVESTLGSGSVFTLWMPAADAPAGGLKGSGTAAVTDQARRVSGFHAAGEALLADLDGILGAYAERLRAEHFGDQDPADFAARLGKQAAPLLADLAIGLATLGDGEDFSDALDDSSEVRRICAMEHGRRRGGLGWDEAGLAREYEALQDELVHRVLELDLGNGAAPVLAAVSTALEDALAQGVAAMRGD